MATKGIGNESDEIVNIKCCICEKKNITREAEKYCVECQNYYCTPCADMHKMFLPTSSGHKLLDKSDFGTSGSHSSLPCFPTERCSLHTAKLLDMYCKNHDEIVCATCVALIHRSCQNIHSVPDEIDDLYKQSVAGFTKQQLYAAKKTMEDVKKVKENLITEVRAHRSKAVDSVREFRKEMEAVLEKLENESVKEIEEQYGKIETSLQEEIKEAEKFADDLEDLARKLSKCNGNTAQEFICVKTAEKNLEKAKDAEGPLAVRRDVELVFRPDLNIRRFLHDMKKIGHISSSFSTQTRFNPKNTVYAVKQRKEINVKLPTDKSTCWLGGSCYTSDGWLLLTDDNNKKLKRVNISTESIKDHLDLKAGCTGICQTAEHEVAISSRNQAIQFVLLGDMMTTTKQLKLDHRCFGLAYNKDRLFVSDDCYAAVYIHDMKGNMLRKIATDKSGNLIFSATRHITVRGDSVYVADQTKGLIFLDTQGNYESTFTDADLINPFGICTDGRGNILVSGNGSSNIVQISENSKQKMGVLGKVNNSISACFDQHQKKLFITQDSSNSVNVYELE